MSSKHYDIVIIGGSVAARIAAALLAKQGNKVLFLRNREAKAPAWFHSSIFLEKLLGVLGGRACFVAQQPIQVISEKARVTLSSDVELEKELSREFGDDGAAVYRWLEELRLQGIKLEEFFWETGGLPWPSLKAKGHLKFLSLKRRINWHELEAPVSQSIERFGEATKRFLTDLLQGLSSTRVTQLSYSRAAMLWAQALRPENLKEPEFSEMLNKRFEQFHGAKGQIDDLNSLDYNGSRWTGGQFMTGGSFTADNFLLGDKQWINTFAPLESSRLPLPESPVVYRTSNLAGQLSPLLGSRIICGGELPMRMAIEEQDEELLGQIVSDARSSESLVRLQMEAILPFAKYRFTKGCLPLKTETSNNGERAVKPLASLPIRIDKNLYCADRTVLLPEMGAAGAALLGWTLAENLGKKNDKP
jgi:glycine/D-amino acid oxidase-like deaminating enzyme